MMVATTSCGDRGGGVTSRLYCVDNSPPRAENLCVSRWLIVLGLVACGKSDSTPCGAVAAKFLEIANHDLSTLSESAKVDAVTLRAVSDQLPAMRDALVEVCTDGKWTEPVKKCLVQANDHVAFTACEGQLTDEQR